MIFNLKTITGCFIFLAGIGLPSYLLLKKNCSFTKSNYFYRSMLNTTESILNCEGEGKNYSVFLALKENTGNNGKKEELSFKFVDNKENGKVKWGPGAKAEEEWTDWGIAVYKDGGKGTKYDTAIRVPRSGKTYYLSKPWTTVIIPCQKSNLKLKQDSGGRISRSKGTQFEIGENNSVKMIGVFDWKDGFQPKIISCSS